MVIKKELGQIQEVRFGHGGYQDVQMGLWLTMGKKGGGWGVATSINAGWSMAMERQENAKWTEQDRLNNYAKAMKEISELLVKAKVDDVTKLKGIPVEVTFENNVLASWRVLEEVL